MTAVAVAVATAVAGWALLAPYPLALLLSQIPAAVVLLAWLIDRLANVDLDRRPIRSHHAVWPAQHTEPVEPTPLPVVVSLDDHRDRKAA